MQRFGQQRHAIGTRKAERSELSIRLLGTCHVMYQHVGFNKNHQLYPQKSSILLQIYASVSSKTNILGLYALCRSIETCLFLILMHSMQVVRARKSSERGQDLEQCSERVSFQMFSHVSYIYN